MKRLDCVPPARASILQEMPGNWENSPVIHFAELGFGTVMVSFGEAANVDLGYVAPGVPQPLLFVGNDRLPEATIRIR